MCPPEVGIVPAVLQPEPKEDHVLERNRSLFTSEPELRIGILDKCAVDREARGEQSEARAELGNRRACRRLRQWLPRQGRHGVGVSWGTGGLDRRSMLAADPWHAVRPV